MARNSFYPFVCIFIFALSVFSGAAIVSVDKCGHLNTVQPTILGRNVTFTFTPSLYDTNTTFRWERINKQNLWSNLSQDDKFVQFEKNGTFYLVLTNTVAKDDEVYYRIQYDNDTVSCTMESQLLTLQVAPSVPVFENLKNIGDCTNCIVGEDGAQFSVICRITGGTEPITVTMEIGDESLIVLNDHANSGYIAFFYLYNSHHMARINCSVKNDALTAPLRVSASVYVIKPPIRESFEVPGIIKEGDPINITCSFTSGRPAPTLSLNVSDTKLSQVHQANTFDNINQSYTSVISLNTFKKIWNGQIISCCRQSDWYTEKIKCFKSERVQYFFEPIVDFNISGSVLEISTGSEVYVKCTARSNPESNISWIEHSASSDVTPRKLKQCYQGTECDLAIQGERIMQKYIICNSENVLGAYSKNLTLNIVEKKAGRTRDHEGTTGLDNSIYWILHGSVLAMIAVIITIGVMVGIKKRNTKKAKLAPSYIAAENSSRHKDDKNCEQPLDPNINSNVGKASSRPGNMFCEINNISGEMSCENVTYAVVNKTGQVHAGAKFSNSQVEGGQLLYADLDFDPHGSEPIKRTIVKRRDSPTEYIGIDFLKTSEESARGEETDDTENVYTNQ